MCVRWNFSSTGGFTGWGIKVGPYTRDVTHGTSSLDTPGLGGLRWGSRRQHAVRRDDGDE